MTLEAALWRADGQPGLTPPSAGVPHNRTGIENEGEGIRIFFGVRSCAAAAAAAAAASPLC